jgi:DNA repair photolyase
VKGRILKYFDPWKSPICTCPLKYSLNPYTGCSHSCFYCYITSYIKRGFHGREKHQFLKKLRRDLEEADPSIPVSISNSTDPYQPLERELKHTREALKLLREKDFRVIIITKSDLVLRDIDILKDMKVAVSFTITTINPELSKRIEPLAPSPIKRIEAMKRLKALGIPLVMRLDPIIPFLNDREEEWEKLIDLTSPYIDLVVASTFKPRPDSWLRFKAKFPEEYIKARILYTERYGTTFYLDESLRRKFMERLREIVVGKGIKFSTCREGFRDLHTGESCDGTHLIPT